MVLLSAFFDGSLFTYLILPFLIFFARICDQTIGTLRIVMVAKGQKIVAPILGFFEVLIWLLAISRIFQNLDNWVCYLAYGLGFAAGNYIGMRLEEKLAMGFVKIQVITRKPADILIEMLKSSGYGITQHDAIGGNEPVTIIYTLIKRIELQKVVDIIKAYNPTSFYSVEDVKSVSYGVFPEKVNSRWWRLGK
jgi:uncharacterized protein YebE (UPF0316 family)